MGIASYNKNGELVETAATIKEMATKINVNYSVVSRGLNSQKKSKDYYFRFYEIEPLPNIETDYLCIIDNIKFYRYTEVAEYLGVTKQAVFAAFKRQSNKISGHYIEWAL